MRYMQYYVRHQIERLGKKYVCTVCQRRWSRKSMIHSDCPRPTDIPIYTSWDEIPAHLQTKSRLRQNGFRPGHRFRAIFRYSGGEQTYWLYDIHEAIPRPKPSAKQLINLGHPSVAGMWICSGCRQIFQLSDERHFYGGQLCATCNKKWGRAAHFPEPSSVTPLGGAAHDR